MSEQFIMWGAFGLLMVVMLAIDLHGQSCMIDAFRIVVAIVGVAASGCLKLFSRQVGGCRIN